MLRLTISSPSFDSSYLFSFPSVIFTFSSISSVLTSKVGKSTVPRENLSVLS